MKKTVKLAIGTGVSSLIMIFVVLVVVTLAVLSLGTAQADYKLALKAAEGTRAFYRADFTAEQLLAQIDDILKFSKEVTYREELGRLPELEVIQKENNTYITYYIPVNAKQRLSVTLKQNQAHQKNMRYEIETWRVENIRSWDYGENGLGFEEVLIEEWEE
jgi:hypothetical protein